MRKIAQLASALLFSGLVGALTCNIAVADDGYYIHTRGGANFGFYLGVPFPGYWGYPYYPSYYPYYYPPAVSVPSSPPVYIEQGQQQPAATQQHYWYYCSNPQGYYPYVKTCPPGWQAVSPQPSDQH